MSILDSEISNYFLCKLSMVGIEIPSSRAPGLTSKSFKQIMLKSEQQECESFINTSVDLKKDRMIYDCYDLFEFLKGK